MPTALLLVAISELIYGLLLGAVWAVRRLETSLAFWSLASLCTSAGTLLYYLRGAIPDVLSIAAGNMLLLLTGTLRWAGLRRFEGQPISPWQYLSAPLILFVVYAFREPLGLTAAHRTVIILLSGVILIGLMILDSVRANRAEPLVMRRVLIAINVFSVGLQFLQIAVVGLQQPKAELSFIAWQGWYPVAMLVFFSNYALVNLSSFMMLFERRETELVRAGTLDALTSLLNRAGFKQLAERQRERSERDRQPLSVLVMDLDHFKRVNDTHGHEAGDQVLQAFARSARASLRPTDLLSRPGGEEFWALLPNTDLDEARRVAQRVCEQFRAVRVAVGEHRIAATVSLGVAQLQSAGESLQAALARADQALYLAKHAGRDRISVATGPV